MKNITLLLSLSFCFLLLVACNKKEDKKDSSPVIQPVTKELFSSDWSVSNNAWEIDFGNGNSLSGGQFTSYITWVNGDSCTCTDTRITGTQTSGTYVLQSCTVTSNVSGNADCTYLSTTTPGTYTNSNGKLRLQRNPPHGAILEYH